MTSHPPQKIILILGAGPNIGLSTSKFFTSKSYKTVVVSRNPSDELNESADLVIKADFSDPGVIKGVFEQVRKEMGIPGVVVYNPYIGLINPDPLSIPLDEWISGLNVNFISAYAAAQEAVKGFRELPKEIKKTFFFTGNCGIHIAIPALMNLGMSKNAAAHMIECATISYKDEGFRFYFVDERKEDGGPGYVDLDGLAHAEEFYDLAEKEGQGPWEYTFVKGKGYVNFEGRIGPIPTF